MRKATYSITSIAAVALTSTISTSTAMASEIDQTNGYVLADNGATLLTMNSLSSADKFKTLQLSEQLDAIAYRPVTGDLIGFSRNKEIYSIDVSSGELTDLSANFSEEADIGNGAVAFDFNNAIDAVRLVGSSGANLVYFPDSFGDERASTVQSFTETFYAEGDINEGAKPLVFANAYTNAIPGTKASSTFQYALDANTDALVSLANNAGTLQTVGPVTVDGTPVDLVSAGGMDIVSMKEGHDEAYAVLQIKGADTSGLYSIDLESAEAVLIGDLGITGTNGFAAHN